MQPPPKPTEPDENTVSADQVVPELSQPTLPYPPGWEQGLFLPAATYRTIGERRAAENPKKPGRPRKSPKRSSKNSIFSLSYWFDGDTRREIRLWLDERDFRMWIAGLVLLMVVIGLIVVVSELSTPKVTR
jgi:hypothetical protein